MVVKPVGQDGRASNRVAALLLGPPLTGTQMPGKEENYSENQRGTLTNLSGRVRKSPKHTCLANPQFVILKKKMTMTAKKGEFTIHKPICVVSATLQKCDS